MSTIAKTSKTTVKKARCKMASPISNDRAEAFVGPQAEVRPRFGDVPTERDKRAFELHAHRLTQRAIAKKLGCSQPTVHRAIARYRRWFGATLPEDRGEMTGFSRFRVALERHRLFLEHQQELSMQEWEQSRLSTAETKTIKTYPEGRKSGGPDVEEVTTQEQRRRHGARVSHFNAATLLSRELLMLEAGHIGVQRMTCDLAMDADERDRWQRERTTRNATIAQLTATVAELTQKVAELQAQVAPVGRESEGPAHPSDRSSPGGEEGETFGPAFRRGQETRAEREEVFTRSVKSTLHESRIAQKTAAVNRPSTDSPAASPIQQTSCGATSVFKSPAAPTANHVNQEENPQPSKLNTET